jgi:hypothetical protein
VGAELTPEQTRAICRRVYSRYPELQGVRPRVKRQRVQDKERFLLRFEKSVSLPDGGTLPAIVRVVANSSGKILKLTSSR